MNTKSKLKAISIGIAAIMVVSLLAAVTTVSASPGVIVTDCEIGDDNKVYFTIYSAAKADGHMCLNIDGEFEERKRYTLNAGETATLSFRDYRWNGVDDVEVCVDCIDTSCCTPGGQTPQPDLVVMEQWEESVNEDVIVHFIVKNIGDGDAGQSTACMYINDIEKDTAFVPALAGGESHVGAFAPEPCPPLTTIAVTVCADNDDVVDESDETNNCMTNEYTCPAKPDLVVSAKYETVNEDGQVIVHFVIENIGDGDAGESYATLYINDMVVEKQNVLVQALGPDGRFASEFAAEDCCTPGTTITVRVCTDDTHVVDERDETNNCETNYFTCPIPLEPDLVVSAKYETVNEDGQVIVHFVIENIGDGDAGESYATLYINDMVVEKQNVLVQELGPNGRFASEFAAEDCTPGTTITVKVCTDDTHVVDESDETNNCETNYFTCPPELKPDLVVIEMSEEPVRVDGQVIVHFVIQNDGDARAGESYATLYIDDMSVEIQNVEVPELGLNGRFIGKFAAVDCTVGTPINVRVCADDTHVVEESDETNNCETEYYTLDIPTPDLIVIEMSEEPVRVDQQVIVHFVIQNIGDGEAGASTACLEINGVMIGTASVPVLQPGTSYGSEFAAQDCPPLTTITVTVCADNDDVVDESNENNNCLVNQYTCPIPAKPDLVVENKWEEPVDGQVIVHFEIHNNGTAKAGESYATLYIDDMLVKIQNVYVPELGISGIYSGKFAAEPCTPGTTITVRVCADDTHVVEESNETNNCMTNEYTCAAKPDLIVSEAWDEQVYVCCGLWTVIKHFVVENIGGADAGPSIACKYLNGVRMDTASVPTLAAGTSYASAFAPEPCPPGTNITFTVCADDFNDVNESDETNNCRINNCTCPAKPDLVVENKWEEPVDGQVIVHFEIHNNGTVNACESYATLYIDDMAVKLQNVYVPELGPSGIYSGAFEPENCPYGVDITVRVCADDTHVVNETNETNNCMTNIFPCPIQLKPDLVVNNTWGEAVKSDGHVIVHFIIENVGVADAGESYATLYIDNMLVETQNVLVPVIAPNGRFVGAFALELCPNDKDIDVRVCADDTKVVNESNENNNCMTNIFTCLSPGPDLEITKTVVTTIADVALCDYHVDYTVTNNGNEIADWCCGNNNSVALFVDGVLAQLDDNIPALGPGASWNGDFDLQSACVGPATINITVCADHYNVVDEGNESNNCEINIRPCGVVGNIRVTKVVTANQFNAHFGDIVSFAATVENENCCCCGLTDIYVNDTLPACLEFVTATPVGWAILPDGTISWHHNTLACGADIAYTIDARLVDCCYDVAGALPQGINTITANATTCRDTLTTSIATATVWPDPGIRMDITKEVWNVTSGEWADTYRAPNGTDVTFRCTIHNNGTCRNLSYIQVWDAMEDSLVYNWSLNVPYNVIPIDVEPSAATTLYWEFGPIVLEHCDWLNFTINATVDADLDEVDNNTLRVRVWSERFWDGTWSQMFDTKMVNVTSSG
ncbi:hypothetical protein C5S29_06600 [ANME-1 cluster archaeon GoMg3.2]|nr:hypothetical protein [ANME-1 cluster archaeon GoMg3.2]